MPVSESKEFPPIDQSVKTHFLDPPSLNHLPQFFVVILSYLEQEASTCFDNMGVSQVKQGREPALSGRLRCRVD